MKDDTKGSKKTEGRDTGTALVRCEDYAIMKAGEEGMKYLAEAGGASGLQIGDLEKVTLPAGKSKHFSRGDESMEEVRGIVLHIRDARAYYAKKYGDGETGPPDCSSDNMIAGEGDPGGPCAQCPNNEWDSAREGTGKACGEHKLLFIMEPGSLLPLIVNISPGSIKAARAYFIQLGARMVPMYGVITTITLETVSRKGGGGEFARAKFARGEVVSDDVKAQVQKVLKNLLPAFEAPQRDDAEDSAPMGAAPTVETGGEDHEEV